jgi:hypothetical protein
MATLPNVFLNTYFDNEFAMYSVITRLMRSKDKKVRSYFAIFSTPDGIKGSLSVKVPKKKRVNVKTLIRRMIGIIK